MYEENKQTNKKKKNGKTTDKAIKKAIKAEITPLLVGIRNDLSNLAKALKKIFEKDVPSVQKVTVENQTQIPETQKVRTVNPQKEVEVTNFPDNIRVRGLKGYLKSLIETINPLDKQLKNITGLIRSNFSALSDKTHKVKVENQIELPDVQKVEVTNQQKQKEVQRVQIENSTPNQAIPVVLTSHDKKRFYEVLTAISSSKGGDNKSIIDLLTQIESNTDELELKADTVNLNVDELEALLQELINNNQSGELHNDYKSFDVSLTTTEQEVDLEGTFNLFAISTASGSKVEIKLNSALNDIIVLGSQGQIAHDRFAVNKFFMRSQSGTTNVTIFVSRKI